MQSIRLLLAVSTGILLVLAGHFQWTGCWFAVSLLEVCQKSPLDWDVQPEMPEQAVETHSKITAVAQQQNLDSGYPKSDRVWPESTQKSSGIIKTSHFLPNKSLLSATVLSALGYEEIRGIHHCLLEIFDMLCFRRRVYSLFVSFPSFSIIEGSFKMYYSVV